jgi:hypothetical protein
MTAAEQLAAPTFVAAGILPPGLLCATCTRPFEKQLAKHTPNGWVHAVSCLEGDGPAPRRDCKVTDCPKDVDSLGYCSMHYRRWRRHGDPLNPGRSKPEPLHIEDVEWMAETGECITGAARRLGRSVDALERALIRAGRRDLLRLLVSREGDWNSPGNYAHTSKQKREVA